MTHGIAIVGLGTVGLRYVEQFAAHESFDIVAGYDTSESAQQNARSRFGITIATSVEELLARSDVDLVYIAVPPHGHEDLVDLAIETNTAILCEKPLGVDEERSAAMVERVERSGLPAAVNFVFGAAPSATALVADVDRHDVHSAELRVHFEHWPRTWQANAQWLRDRDQGGWTREVVSHYVFLIHRLLGPAAIEHSVAWFPPDGTSEQRLTTVLDCDGVPVTIIGSSDSAGADEVEFTVRGHHRSWRLTNWYEYSTAVRDGPWNPAIDPSVAAGPAAYAAQLDQLDALVKHEQNGLSTFREALEVQRIIEALVS